MITASVISVVIVRVVVNRRTLISAAADDGKNRFTFVTHLKIHVCE